MYLQSKMKKKKNQSRYRRYPAVPKSKPLPCRVNCGTVDFLPLGVGGQIAAPCRRTVPAGTPTTGNFVHPYPRESKSAPILHPKLNSTKFPFTESLKITFLSQKFPNFSPFYANSWKYHPYPIEIFPQIQDFDRISHLGFTQFFPKDMNFRSLDEFWAFYMTQHSKPSTRRWHFAGTLGSILLLLISMVFNWWVVVFAPVFGYGLAWYSHFFIEGNIPASYGHPVWSFLCDFKMFGLMLTGNLDKEIKRLGKRPVMLM